MDWAGRLEQKADELVAELKALRRTNRNLAARVRKLEKEAEVGVAADWKADRADLERRVARLVSKLEELAED